MATMTDTLPSIPIGGKDQKPKPIRAAEEQVKMPKNPSSPFEKVAPFTFDLPSAQPVSLTATGKASSGSDKVPKTSGDGAVSATSVSTACANAQEASDPVPPAQTKIASEPTPAPDPPATKRPSRSLTGKVVPAHVAGRLLGLTAFDMGAHLPVDSILNEPDEPFVIKPEYLIRPKAKDSAFCSLTFRISDCRNKRSVDPDIETKLYSLISKLPPMPAPFENVDIIDTFHFLSGDTRLRASHPGILIVCLQRRAVQRGIDAAVAVQLWDHLKKYFSTSTDGLDQMRCIDEKAYPGDLSITPATFFRFTWEGDTQPVAEAQVSACDKAGPTHRIKGSIRCLPAIDRPAGDFEFGAFRKKLMTAGYTMGSAYLFTRVGSTTIDPCSDVPVTGLYQFILPYELQLFVSTLRRMPNSAPGSIVATEHVVEYLQASTAFTLAAFVGYTPITLQAMWNSIKREVDRFDPHPRSEHFAHNVRLSADGLWILIDPSTLALAMYMCDFATSACALNFNFVDHILVKHPQFA